MEMKINERGYWEGVDKSKHLFDERLANSILHLIIKNQLSEVMDFGCGDGSYTKLLNDNGVPCMGVDGNPNTPKLSGSTCTVLDLSKPITHLRKVDLVLCLEVGEHIPLEYEHILLNNITDHTNKAIIMSWAIPGQGGFGHVNCRSIDHIVSQVEMRGFKYCPAETIFLRTRAYRSWFKETIMVFYTTK